MKISITILEDQPIEAEHLRVQLETWSNLNNFPIEIETYASGETYIEQRNSKEETSTVFFLDIQMGRMTGLDIAKKLRQEGYRGYIVFLTAFREYVFHGYEVHALNYLLKPVQREPLFLCLDEIAKEVAGRFYLYRNKQEIIRIPYKDILCFSSSLHYVDILTVSGGYCQYATLNNVIEYLPQEFIRTHRSYIVNMAHIYKMSGNAITLSNFKTIQIGRSYMKQVMQAFSKYSLRFDTKEEQ